MSMWAEIVNTALLGCGRKPLSFNGATGNLSDLLAQLDQSHREGALLVAAALAWRDERVSALPMKDTQPLPEACEPDDTPRCSERQATYLAMILRGEHHGTVPEWVEKATETGVSAPEELLPGLLAFGLVHWRH